MDKTLVPVPMLHRLIDIAQSDDPVDDRRQDVIDVLGGALLQSRASRLRSEVERGRYGATDGAGTGPEAA